MLSALYYRPCVRLSVCLSHGWIRQTVEVRIMQFSLGSHSTMDLRQPSCMLLSRLALTIVTQSMQGRRRRLLTRCNECSMLPPMWSVSDTRKFDRGLTSLLHDELYWLDVPERVTYQMGVMMYRCLHGQAPRYLADHFTTSSDVASRIVRPTCDRLVHVKLFYYLNVYSGVPRISAWRGSRRRGDGVWGEGVPSPVGCARSPENF